jgi:membrane-bound lytic murein transglycosylase F
LGAQGPTGPEYELVSEFARALDVELKVRTAPSFRDLESLLLSGQGDLIAANLTRTPGRELRFNFGPDYVETDILVLYRRGQRKPDDLSDLAGRKIMIIEGSSYQEAMVAAAQREPALTWETRRDVGMEDLLQAIADGAIDITLADSIIYRLNAAFYPSVNVAFSLPGTLPHAWAFAPGNDDLLAQRARIFMRNARSDGRLAEIRQAFLDPHDRLDRVGMFQFLQQVRERLPPLLPIFQQVADDYRMDWRLLAAMGYQESHWNPEASSYTGVRGIMMLTQPTATQLGVSDRTDPVQSIEGGARYFTELRQRIPARIGEPDRSYMALAAYNIGMGHLEDVRILTQIQGGDPDSWEDVEQRLVLLSQEKWHSQTRHGYARGFETRKYVENVRSYFDILKWMDTRDHPLLADSSFNHRQ